jgi:hypothetical protein
VILGKFIDLFARDSGVRDKLIAERDVVLTCALQALVEDGVMAHLAYRQRNPEVMGAELAWTSPWAGTGFFAGRLLQWTNPRPGRWPGCEELTRRH